LHTLIKKGTIKAVASLYLSKMKASKQNYFITIKRFTK
jgi:hypothetical protein